MCIWVQLANGKSRCAYLGNYSLYTFLSTIQDGLRPLYVASIDGYTETVNVLLKAGADPNLATTVCANYTQYQFMDKLPKSIECNLAIYG